MGKSTTGLTRELASFAVSDAPIDDQVRVLTGRALADTVGVAIAGTGGLTEPVLQKLTAAYGAAPPGSACALYRRERTTAAHAALLNGVAAHVLDYDDVCHSVKGHPSAVLVPALLAQCEETRASGEELARAYAVGVQVAAALWSGVGPSHYADGWHATATLGTVAVAAAASRLLGATADQAAHAIGGAASFAVGSQANFGTMVKSLHVGHAAQWGLLMARAGVAGLTANSQQLEHRFGLLSLLSGGRGDAEAARERLHGDWVVASPRGLNVKKYPSCYFTHRAIDAAIALRDEVPNDAIEHVKVTVSPGSTAVLNFGEAPTALEAKFNGCYLVAVALLAGNVDLESFGPATLCRDDVARLSRRISWTESDVPPVGDAAWSEGYAVVTVTTRDSGQSSCRVDIPRGDCRLPLSEGELWAKFSSCLDSVEQPRDPDKRELFDRLLNLPFAEDASVWSQGL